MSDLVGAPGFPPRRAAPCFCGSGRRFKNCCGSTAAERPPPHGLILEPAWLSVEHCDELVDFLEKQPRSWLTVVDAKSGRERPSNSRVTEKVEMGAMAATVNACLRSAFVDVAEPRMRCVIDWFTSPLILRYSVGGRYDVHADSEAPDPATRQWRRVVDRDVSLLIYLNDGFTGGAISFTNFNFRYQPRRGDLLLFPSDHRYMHRAEPVTAGTRYAIVTWAATIGGPRIALSPPPLAVHVHTGPG